MLIVRGFTRVYYLIPQSAVVAATRQYPEHVTVFQSLSIRLMSREVNESYGQLVKGTVVPLCIAPT